MDFIVMHWQRKAQWPAYNIADGELVIREILADPASPLSDAAGEWFEVAAVDLERAIADLPVGARTVFILHDVEGYRHREIAELTGMAEGTSKAHLHRARRLLREALRPLKPPPPPRPPRPREVLLPLHCPCEPLPQSP